MLPEPQTENGSRSRDSISNTLIVAAGLSIVCSVLVSSTAVLLQPQQLRNREINRQTIILQVAGLYQPGANIGDLYARIEPRMVDLASGEYVDLIDPRDFDALTAARDPELGIAIPEEIDIANIRRRAIYSPVYLVKVDGVIDQIILPVYGSGLWSTMYGYLALANDGSTVRGLSFYEHAETPGLGDQVDDARWRAQWPGKQVYGDDDNPRIEVIRGNVRDGSSALHQVDGLSGATLTGRGVTNLVQYWTGAHGFGPYLQRFRQASDRNE